MGQEVAIQNDRKFDGRAMASLSDGHRKFVSCMIDYGARPKAAARAAKAAGFHPNYGYELMRDENVLVAIREEATKKLAGAALVGISVLVEIAYDKEHKDRYRAAKDLAAINGFTAEQRIIVEHITPDTKGQIAQIKEMAAQLGLDPKQLIAGAGIVEGEFSEVDDEG